MEAEGSLPHSQELSTCPYPEPDQSSPQHPNPISTRYILILFIHPRLDLPGSLFHSGFRTNNLYPVLYSTIRATCPANLIFAEIFI
jgi:hypothetical protein